MFSMISLRFAFSVEQSRTSQSMELNIQTKDISLAEEQRDATEDYTDSQSSSD